MKFIQHQYRHQVSLFPECIEDYMGENNPVRVIDAFVESLNLADAGFIRTTPKETGRPLFFHWWSLN
ncbi:hypothetical protein [Anoxybacterium hadale]|uniref:hypothetical protein n=1 Tax=Anoxybacterium hadale TaxID=3408580 RepID=UPI003B0027DE